MMEILRLAWAGLPPTSAALAETTMAGVEAALQSPLAPHSAQASQIAVLAWVLIGGGALVFLVVLLIAVCALKNSRPSWMTTRTLVIGGGMLFPTVVLSALFVYTLVIGQSLSKAGTAGALRLEITGEMWWWRVHYLNADGHVDFATANEIHVPAGRSVEVSLKSADVIHGFWVPGIAGMRDMIPGRVNTVRFVASKASVLRGQCTEFCGTQHAKMAFDVQIHDAASFERWLAAQREQAPPPANAVLAKGQALFFAHCASCHAVRGTPARGESGPDLTHVGSRRSIAAGVLPNNIGTLAGWIASSQHLKPGNRMPSFEHFAGADLTALAAYVESLR